MNNFFRELLKPRILPIFIALIIVLAFIISLPSFLQRYAIFYSPTKTNSYGYAAYAIKYKMQKDVPAVLLLGPSTVREATQSDKVVTDRLNKKAPQQLQFLNMGDQSESISEMMAIFTTAHPVSGSYVVIGVDPNVLTQSKAATLREYHHQRMRFLDYSQVKTFLLSNNAPVGMKLPAIFSSGLWIADYFQNTPVEKLRTSNWDSLLKPFQRNRYFSVLSQDDKVEFAKEYQDFLLSQYPQNYQFSLTLLNALIQYIQSQHCHPILLLLPMSHYAISVNQHLGNHYYEKVLELANFNHIPILNFYKNSAQFDDNEFYDIYHFNNAGRAHFLPLFVQQLALIINKEGNNEPNRK